MYRVKLATDKGDWSMEHNQTNEPCFDTHHHHIVIITRPSFTAANSPNKGRPHHPQTTRPTDCFYRGPYVGVQQKLYTITYNIQENREYELSIFYWIFLTFAITTDMFKTITTFAFVWRNIFEQIVAQRFLSFLIQKINWLLLIAIEQTTP